MNLCFELVGFTEDRLQRLLRDYADTGFALIPAGSSQKPDAFQAAREAVKAQKLTFVPVLSLWRQEEQDVAEAAMLVLPVHWIGTGYESVTFPEFQRRMISVSRSLGLRRWLLRGKDHPVRYMNLDDEPSLLPFSGEYGTLLSDWFSEHAPGAGGDFLGLYLSAPPINVMAAHCRTALGELVRYGLIQSEELTTFDMVDGRLTQISPEPQGGAL